MSLLDAITNLATGTYVVTRRTGGSLTAGIWTPGTASTFSMVASVQPASGLQRVTGGQDMISDDQGQHVTDVRVFYTKTLIKARSPTTDPDVVTFDGDDWTVFRAEPWDHTGRVYYRCVMTRQTLGAS